MPSDRHQACFATLLWLAENDYLSYGRTIAQEALDQAVLNQRGFNLLVRLEDRNEFLPEADTDSEDGVEMSESLTRSHLLRHKIKYESSTRLNHYIRYFFTL